MLYTTKDEENSTHLLKLIMEVRKVTQNNTSLPPAIHSFFLNKGTSPSKLSTLRNRVRKVISE